MVILFSISSGLLIILLSLFLIRREFNKATRLRNSNFSGLSDGNVKELLSYLDRLETTVEEMNESFYEIANDLEGKYSIHNKEIEIIDSKVNDINLLSKELAMLLKFQGKELASIKESEGKKHIKSGVKTDMSFNDKTIVKQVEIDDTKKELLSENIVQISKKNDEYTYDNNKNNEKEDLKNEILRLKALGMDENQIARNLSRGVREIKMLLNFLK